MAGKNNSEKERRSLLLLSAINRAQESYISGKEPRQVFEDLLQTLLEVTDSEYGFIGEVLYKANGDPYLKTYAITNIAWTDELQRFYRENAPNGLEFFNLKTLFGAALTTGEPVISNTPADDPRSGGLPEGHPPLNHFCGIPFKSGDRLVGLVGISNRPGGYDEELISFLQPFLNTCTTIALGIRREEEQEKALEALRESERRFSAILTASLNPVIIINQRGLIQFFNKAAERVFGYTENEVKGRNVKMLMPEPYHGKHDGYLRHYLATGEKKVMGTGREVPARRKDGTEIAMFLTLAEMDAHGEKQFLGVMADISDLKEAQRELAENRERLDLALKGADLGLWDWEVDSGKVTFNERWAEMLGYSLDELKPDVSTWEKLMYPDDAERVMKVLKKHLEGRTPYYETEHRLLKKDGSVCWVLDRGKVFKRGEHGVPLRATGTHLDITERKEAERRLHTAKEQAEEATKLKDKFVSLVSHDLRGPLSTLVGLIDVTIEDLKDEEAKDMLQSASESGRNLLKLIEELLNISRLKTGKVVPHPSFFNAHHLAEQGLETVRPLVEPKGITLVNDMPADLRLYADKTLFLEVVRNILSNAVKFTPPGGTVTCCAPGGTNGLAVRDTGVGMDKNRIEGIFRYDVKSTTLGTSGERGTGLGMPLSRDIMEAHGGSLSVETEEGKGSTFIAALPKVLPRVAVADDDPTQLMVVKSALKSLDVELLTAANGQEALELMRREKPHLLVTDLSMPVMDGYELISHLREVPFFDKLGVLVMTGVEESELQEKVFMLGADDFIRKPIKPAELRARVAKFFD